MTRMLAYLANQTDRVRCAVSQEVEALGFGADADAWGIGSVHADEVLLRKRPVEGPGGARLAEMVRDLRTGGFLATARRFNGAGRSPENIAPYRFRQWLGAVDGDLAALRPHRDKLHGAIPDFLARNVRGDGADERVAHLAFAALHASGALEDPDIDRATVTAAVRAAVAVADAQTGGPLPLALMLTNGRVLVAFARGVPMSWAKRQGVRDAKACAEAESVDGPRGRRLDPETLKHLRYVMVACCAEVKGFQPLATEGDGAVVGVDRSLDVRVTA